MIVVAFALAVATAAPRPPAPPVTAAQLRALVASAFGCRDLRPYAALEVHWTVAHAFYETREDGAYGVRALRWKQTTRFAGHEIDEGYDGRSWTVDDGVPSVGTHAPLVPGVFWYRACGLPGAERRAEPFSKPRRVVEGATAYDLSSTGSETLWFDARTHLLARTKVGTFRTDYIDYRRVRGVAFAFRRTEEDQAPPEPHTESVGGPDPVGHGTLDRSTAALRGAPGWRAESRFSLAKTSRRE